MIHVDAYRLSGPGDLAGLGFDELSEAGLGVVEWAERVRAALPAARLWRVALEHRPDGGRTATVTTPTRLGGKWLHESSAP